MHSKPGMKYSNLSGTFILSFATYVNAHTFAINNGIDPTVKAIPARSQDSKGNIASG